MKLKIGISPCPNDTFIFDAIYSKKIDLHGLEFEFILEDVETLNQLALQGEIDIVKISYANYFNVLPQYCMLRAGSALGVGVGPLLVAKTPFDLSEINTKKIAIPGVHTTAHFLFQFAFPSCKQKQSYVFSAIENAVLNNEVDAGVIIHENRFTYAEKGLEQLLDLGNYWETKTQLPIPLGGIAIKRNIENEVQLQVNQLIKESILLAQKSYPHLSEFVQCNAQEMQEDIMRKHIELYVNDFSLDVGENGIRAVEQMKTTLSNKSELKLFIF